MSSITTDSAVPASGQLHRTIDWRGAFWVASGVPALVLFSIGGIAGTTGNLAFAIWIVSMILGLIQSFTYAEIAGLFPQKSGGASVYGATAWLRYSKFIAPLSVWCNWLAWTPVLSLGCSIAAAYILNALAPIPSFTRNVAGSRRLARRSGQCRQDGGRRDRRADGCRHAGDPRLDALQRHARPGQLLAQRDLLDRRRS